MPSALSASEVERVALLDVLGEHEHAVSGSGGGSRARRAGRRRSGSAASGCPRSPRRACGRDLAQQVVGVARPGPRPRSPASRAGARFPRAGGPSRRRRPPAGARRSPGGSSIAIAREQIGLGDEAAGDAAVDARASSAPSRLEVRTTAGGSASAQSRSASSKPSPSGRWTSTSASSGVSARAASTRRRNRRPRRRRGSPRTPAAAAPVRKPGWSSTMRTLVPIPAIVARSTSASRTASRTRRTPVSLILGGRPAMESCSVMFNPHAVELRSDSGRGSRVASRSSVRSVPWRRQRGGEITAYIADLEEEIEVWRAAVRGRRGDRDRGPARGLCRRRGRLTTTRR